MALQPSARVFLRDMPLLAPTMRLGHVSRSVSGGIMADKIHGFLPATAEMPTDRQRLITRYIA